MESNVDEPTSPVSPTLDGGALGGTKRKRSGSPDLHQQAAPPAKSAKTHAAHLQINYLARQYADVLPLVSVEDTMPAILQLLADYGGVLERHESLAGNLGARPLGPILIKRFERLFDGGPRVLKSHGKDGATVTWLDVVEFARHKPEQFNLEKMRDGVRVCQFYTKQCRVEISEEDFLLINSGMPQKLIPPQPIAEDEEKELGTLEIMEKKMSQVIQLADQVSARARQMKHRLTGRKNAIASRREGEAGGTVSSDQIGKENVVDSPSTFTAVNSGRPRELQNGSLSALQNGRAYAGATASPTTKAELLSCFNNQRERLNEVADYAVPAVAAAAAAPAGSSSRSHKKQSRPSVTADNIDYASILLNSASPVPIPSTPSNLVSYPRQTQAERYDDSGPYKAEMLSRMDSMLRGDRVMPPCDRCRRLHMDCLKNLTACLGCTKKHAKCSWKEVTEQELLDNPHHPRPKEDILSESNLLPLDGPPQPVRDEELLGEDDSEEDEDGNHIAVTAAAAPKVSSNTDPLSTSNPRAANASRSPSTGAQLAPPSDKVNSSPATTTGPPNAAETSGTGKNENASLGYDEIGDDVRNVIVRRRAAIPAAIITNGVSGAREANGNGAATFTAANSAASASAPERVKVESKMESQYGDDGDENDEGGEIRGWRKGRERNGIAISALVGLQEAAKASPSDEGPVGAYE